jgi:hypothetical protein
MQRQCLLQDAPIALCLAFAPAQQNQSATQNENTETLHTVFKP